MGLTGIVTAMPEELQFLSGICCGRTVCACSGPGKANAAAATAEMIVTHHPDRIFNVGVAGVPAGASPLVPGDIVLGTETAYHDVWCGEGNLMGQVQGQPARFPADSALLSSMKGLLSAPGKGAPGIHCGLVGTGDQFYIGPDEDRRIRSLYPDILVCDMEAAAVAQVCRRHSVPCLCIKVVSDIHDSDEAQKASYSNWKENCQGSFLLIINALKGI